MRESPKVSLLRINARYCVNSRTYGNISMYPNNKKLKPKANKSILNKEAMIFHASTSY